MSRRSEHRRHRVGRDSPLAGRGRFFGPGELRIAVLSLLADSPAHGYEVMARLEQRCGAAYQASPGAIYPTLQLLEDEGLVEVQAQDGRKTYRLTADGSAVLGERQADVAEIWRRAESWNDWGVFGHPDAAEIVGPALRLAKASLKAVVHSHGDPDVVDAVRQVLDDARVRIERATPKGRR